MYPSMWACRGRNGAWDISRRGYKEWNKAHLEDNKKYLDIYNTATLGWYSFYPIDDKHPGNFHSRYQFTDDIDYLGVTSIAYNFSIVYNDIESEQYFSIPALRRNIAHYRKYDDLRKKYYFSDRVAFLKFVFYFVPRVGSCARNIGSTNICIVFFHSGNKCFE